MRKLVTLALALVVGVFLTGALAGCGESESPANSAVNQKTDPNAPGGGKPSVAGAGGGGSAASATEAK